MATLTKAELVETLIENIGVTRREAVGLINLFFNEITNALVMGDTVMLARFGQFRSRRKTARPGRNPKTGEPKEVSARTVATFKPSEKLLLGIAWAADNAAAS